MVAGLSSRRNGFETRMRYHFEYPCGVSKVSLPSVDAILERLPYKIGCSGGCTAAGAMAHRTTWRWSSVSQTGEVGSKPTCATNNP